MSALRTLDLEEEEDARGSTFGMTDEAIRGTDDDALLSRLSAARLGYISDPSAPLFAKRGPVPHRPPVINIGTHHRTYAVDNLVEQAVEQGSQVVSLGAGSDTRYWRLGSIWKGKGRESADITYIEVDLPQVTASKARKIAMKKELLQPMLQPGSSDSPKISQGGSRLDLGNYHLIPLDLRKDSLEPLLDIMDTSRPVIFIAECVLCYMTREEGDKVLSWFSQTFGDCAAVIYEMHGLQDAFGNVMKRNLQLRGISLPGAVFSSPQEYAARLTSPECGYDGAIGLKLTEIRERVIPKEEIQRLATLEPLDEIEELELLLNHYSIMFGYGGGKLSQLAF